MENKKKTASLNDNLKQLAEISEWFNGQKDLDVETGIEKVKIAAGLIKSSKEKLNKLENEFKEIEKEFSETQDQGETL
ncbi:MAG: hypothetical protein WCX69_01245 [Candidatus Paceibacterota bacterium]